nr:uncharacterized protein LOC109169597 [Ipomoea batatas]
MLAKQHHSSPFPSPSCVRPNGSSAALGGRNRSSKHPWSVFPPPFRARRFADGGRRRRGQYDAVCFSLCYSPVPSPHQAIHLLEKAEIQKVANRWRWRKIKNVSSGIFNFQSRQFPWS